MSKRDCWARLMECVVKMCVREREFVRDCVCVCPRVRVCERVCEKVCERECV